MAGRRPMVQRSTRRLSTWLQFNNVSTTITAGGGTLIFTLNATALALWPFTVVRSHFELELLSDQAAAIESQAASFGIAVVSSESSGAGVTALPTPATDMGSDLWFVHKNLYADESVLTDRTRPSTKVSIDSKAMRKVNGDQDVVVLAELNAGASGFIINITGRMLIKVN